MTFEGGGEHADELLLIALVLLAGSVKSVDESDVLGVHSNHEGVCTVHSLLVIIRLNINFRFVESRAKEMKFFN